MRQSRKSKESRKSKKHKSQRRLVQTCIIALPVLGVLPVGALEEKAGVGADPGAFKEKAGLGAEAQCDVGGVCSMVGTYRCR
jgi:hypothetical protein